MSKQVVLDSLAARNSKDLTALGAILADEFTATILPSLLGLPIMTKEKFLARAEKTVAGIPDLKFTDSEETIEAGSSVVVHVRHTTSTCPTQTDYQLSDENEGNRIHQRNVYIFHVRLQA
ncbi:hypothetical protein C8J57DRAFT_1235326 [Mycena rebaudengoi]|nr:hypothetical protein C8J57DRAFT_1235326 [Mycena rebaudengoi]